MNINNRIAATLFPKNIICLRNISINTLHKGDDVDDDDDNNNNKYNNDRVFSPSDSFLSLALFAVAIDSQRGTLKKVFIFAEGEISLANCIECRSYTKACRKYRRSEAKRRKPNFFRGKPVPVSRFEQNPTRIKAGKNPGLVGEMPASKNSDFVEQ